MKKSLQDFTLIWISDRCYSLHIDGLVQDCCNSSVLAVELLQFYIKPSICNKVGLTTDFILVVFQHQSRSIIELYEAILKDYHITESGI